MVLVFGQGPSWNTVRDASLALFNAIAKLVWADPTLAGVLQQGRIGQVESFTLKQYDPNADDSASSAAAVAAQVSFALQVENSYVP